MKKLNQDINTEVHIPPSLFKDERSGTLVVVAYMSAVANQT